jgi:glycerol-3-phosphate cytidylyltransferase
MVDKRLYTGGTFDLFHYGHVNFLKKCKKIANQVVVSLNTDDFASKYKSLPIMSYNERKTSLLSCPFVDRVVPNTFGFDSKPTILQVDPDIIAVGDDWARKDYYSQMGFTQDWLDEKNIVLIYIPYTKGISTSEIRQRIKNR